MTDLEKWKLHGPVAAMRGEVAERDRERQQWHAARHRTSIIFDRRGRITQLDQPGAEGSVHRTTFLHDDKGRLAEVTYATVGASTHSTTLYSYDAVGRIERVVERHANGSERTIGVYGRLSERRRHMGRLGDEYTTFAYDHHGNSVHERTQHQDREMRLDENGAMETAAESVRTDEWRFEYTYDRVGNWTERVVNARFDPHAEFQRSNVERRTIQYYEA